MSENFSYFFIISNLYKSRLLNLKKNVSINDMGLLVAKFMQLKCWFRNAFGIRWMLGM